LRAPKLPLGGLGVPSIPQLTFHLRARSVAEKKRVRTPDEGSYAPRVPHALKSMGPSLQTWTRRSVRLLRREDYLFHLYPPGAAAAAVCEKLPPRGTPRELVEGTPKPPKGSLGALNCQSSIGKK
jgi:hypothetical protein